MSKKFLFIRRTTPYQNLRGKFLYCKAFLNFKFNPYPKELGVNPIFVFNHIPKCGGTSFNLILSKWFYLKRDYPPNEIKYRDGTKLAAEIKKFEISTPKLENINPWEILAGHYHKPKFTLSSRFPKIYINPEVNLISFVRNPLAHHLSMYKYGKKMGHDFVNGLNLKDYLKNDTNLLASALECTFENYKDRIDSYFFIGIVEEYDQSLRQLSKKLGRTMIEKIPIENQTSSNTLYKSLSEVEIKLFKEDNKLDYLIYKYCLTKLQNNVV